MTMTISSSLSCDLTPCSLVHIRQRLNYHTVSHFTHICKWRHHIPPNGGNFLPHYTASQPRQRNCELVFCWREAYPYKRATWSSLLSNTPWSPEEHHLLEGSKALPIWSGNNMYCTCRRVRNIGGMTMTRENRRARRKPCPTACPPHISHGMTWDRTRTSVVTGRWPTATARHLKTINLNVSPYRAVNTPYRL
jgi:hypothetical protein